MGLCYLSLATGNGLLILRKTTKQLCVTASRPLPVLDRNFPFLRLLLAASWALSLLACGYRAAARVLHSRSRSTADATIVGAFVHTSSHYATGAGPSPTAGWVFSDTLAAAAFGSSPDLESLPGGKSEKGGRAQSGGYQSGRISGAVKSILTYTFAMWGCSCRPHSCYRRSVRWPGGK